MRSYTLDTHTWKMKFLATFVFCSTLGIGQESSAGAALRMGFGARGMGMGNALSAVRRGDLVGYYNPSLLPFQTGPTFSASLGVLTFDRRLNAFSYTKNLRQNAGISLSILNAGVGNIQGRNRDGEPTEIVSTSENAFMLSFGLQPSPSFSLGVTAKILYFSLYTDVSSRTAGVDIGATYLFSDALTGSVVIQDLNSKYKWDTSKLYGSKSGNSTTDNFPLRKKFALSYVLGEPALLVSGEVEYTGTSGYSRFGVEWNASENFSVRAGLDRVAFNRSVDSKPSFGLSFTTELNGWKPSIDYAFVLEPYGAGMIHVLGIRARIE